MRRAVLLSCSPLILSLLLVSCDEKQSAPDLKAAKTTSELLDRWRELSPEEATTLLGLEFIERWCELDLDTLDKALNEIDDSVVWCNFVPKMKKFHLQNPAMFVDLAKETKNHCGTMSDYCLKTSVRSVFRSVARQNPQVAIDLVLEKLEPGQLRRWNLRFVFVVALTDDLESVRIALAAYKGFQSRSDRSSFQVALNSVDTVAQRDMILKTASEMEISEADLSRFEERMAELES